MPIQSFDTLEAMAVEAQLGVGASELDHYQFHAAAGGAVRIVPRLPDPRGVQRSENRYGLLEESRRTPVAQRILQELQRYFGDKLGSMLAAEAGISEALWVGPRHILALGRGRRPLTRETRVILRILHGEPVAANPAAAPRARTLADLDTPERTVPRTAPYGKLSAVRQAAIRAQLFQQVTAMDAFVRQQMRREDLAPLLGKIIRGWRSPQNGPTPMAAAQCTPHHVAILPRTTRASMRPAFALRARLTSDLIG